MTILRSFTPLVEPIALDEAFLDVAGARRLHGTGPEIAAAIRAGCRTRPGSIASVGAATTKLLAKLASDLAKPDGMLVVEPGEELDVPAPARRRAAVGRRAGDAPSARPSSGVSTVGELADASRGRARRRARQRGRPPPARARMEPRRPRPVEPEQVAKSVGHEETFPVDVRDRGDLERELRAPRRRRGDAPAGGVGRRAHRAAQGAVRRLPHHQPGAHAAGADGGRRRHRAGRAPAARRRSHRRRRPPPGRVGEQARDRIRRPAAARSTTPSRPVAGELDPVRSARRAAVEESVDAVRARFGRSAVAPGGATPPRDIGP